MSAGKAIDAREARELLTQMIRIRRFEEKCAELYGTGKIRGFLHLYIGEEAVAAGAMPCLRDTDSIFATYREHGHALARGVPAASIMAEMYGKREGCSGGRGGSMHLFDVSRRFYGGNAIVGGALPLAAGMALAEAMRDTDHVVACFFGEGAMAEGEFHESANLAALWKLPLLLLCENNLYAMGTALSRSQANVDLCERARSYGMPAATVDGMDVVAVRAATRDTLAQMRRSRGPQFIEFRTYRFRAHSMFDPELYRSRDEVEQWKKRCPIAAFTRFALEQALLSASEIEAITCSIDAEVGEAVRAAEAGTWEPIDELERHVCAPAQRRPAVAARPGEPR